MGRGGGEEEVTIEEEEIELLPFFHLICYFYIFLLASGTSFHFSYTIYQKGSQIKLNQEPS